MTHYSPNKNHDYLSYGMNQDKRYVIAQYENPPWPFLSRSAGIEASSEASGVGKDAKSNSRTWKESMVLMELVFGAKLCCMRSLSVVVSVFWLVKMFLQGRREALNFEPFYTYTL